MLTPLAVISIIQSVALVAMSLIAIGLGLSVLTWWFWTTARPEPISLAPLEIMSDRRYFQASDDEQSELIKSARDLVVAAKSSRKSRRPVQRTEQHSRPESSKSKPVDPLLK